MREHVNLNRRRAGAHVPNAYVPEGGTAASGSVNDLTLRPEKYALDLYESLEGANVEVVDARVVGATDAYAELWVTVKPKENATRRGGEPGGNIRQVFLFNPARVSFTDRATADTTTAAGVTTVAGRAALTVSPGRVDPANAAWTNSRKPLAGEFSFRDAPVIVVANHFASKSGDQALTSQFQPPKHSSETQRLLQAQAVNTFVKDIRAVQKNARVVVLGDINDTEFSDAAKALSADRALKSALYSLPKNERYPYVYQGNSQVLDQILTSPSIHDYEYDIVHINAEFSDQASDHDPQVLRFRP